VDPPTRFSLTAYEKGQPFKHDFVLTPGAEGTTVARTVDRRNARHRRERG
jgi:hypothetical protein